jgi:hypothetical protein
MNLQNQHVTTTEKFATFSLMNLFMEILKFLIAVSIRRCRL